MNEKWFSLSVEQIEKKLKTNAASGLSRKAARSRYSRASGALFYSVGKSFPAMLLEIISDFALILLLIMAVIALCFNETATAISVLILTFINLAVTSFIYFRSQRLFESISAFFSPTIRVIRDGKLFNIDFRHVVPGDVMLVEAGDVICCDARLVTSDRLKVKMRVDRDNYVLLDKAAGGCVRDDENDNKNYVNMIHAGSVVKSGTARAIVTAVGKYTYLGAMTGGIRVPVSRTVPAGLALLRRYCSKFSMALTLVILPFSLLSLLFSGGDVTLFTTFLTALAVAASSMSQFAATLCKVFFARQIRSCLGAPNPAVIRSADVMDKLVAVDYLFLLDGSILTDGILHFDTAYCADGEIRNTETASRGAYYLAELAELYRSAQSRAVSTGTRAPGRYNEGLDEFIDAVKVDREALKIRCDINGITTGTTSDMNDRLYYSDRGEKLILSISETSEMIKRSSYIQKDSNSIPLTDDAVRSLLRIYENYRRLGKHVIVLTYSTALSCDNDDERRFVGMLVFGESADASTVNAVKRLSRLGVKTLYFTDTNKGRGSTMCYPAPDIPQQFLTPGEVPLTPVYLASRGLPVSYAFGTASVYSGYSDSDIAELINFAHSKGKKVAVSGFSQSFDEVCEKADVFITCSPVDFIMSGRFEHEIETLDTAGDATGKSCPQTVREKAGVIVPRPDNAGKGGLASVVSAFVGAGGAYYNLAGFFRYVLGVQFLRIFTVMFPMLFGSAPLDSRHILFCSMLTDIFVLMIFAFDRCGVENSKTLKALTSSFRSPVYSNAGIIVSAAGGAVTTVILPRLISIFGLQYLYETEYSFISLLLMQLTLFFCIRFKDMRKKGKAKFGKAPLIMVTFEVLFVIVCFASEKFGVLFDITHISFAYFVLTFIPAAVCAVLYYLFRGLNINNSIKK